MPQIEIVLASRNRSKIGQIQGIFASTGIKILSLDDVGISGEAVEDGTTTYENAVLKAQYAKETYPGWVMADDTALYIDALGGKPGIHAQRWAGKNKTAEEIMNFTLDHLKGVPLENRQAVFLTSVVLISPGGGIYKHFTGAIDGGILEVPKCPCQPDMPYSAIFQPKGFEKVWAEMTVEEENAISHRGKAFRKLIAYMNNFKA